MPFVLTFPLVALLTSLPIPALAKRMVYGYNPQVEHVSQMELLLLSCSATLLVLTTFYTIAKRLNPDLALIREFAVANMLMPILIYLFLSVHFTKFPKISVTPSPSSIILIVLLIYMALLGILHLSKKPRTTRRLLGITGCAAIICLTIANVFLFAVKGSFFQSAGLSFRFWPYRGELLGLLIGVNFLCAYGIYRLAILIPESLRAHARWPITLIGGAIYLDCLTLAWNDRAVLPLALAMSLTAYYIFCYGTYRLALSLKERPCKIFMSAMFLLVLSVSAGYLEHTKFISRLEGNTSEKRALGVTYPLFQSTSRSKL
jgi:hypothetical protein